MSDEKYFENARDLFMTPGWREFMEEVEKAYMGTTFDGIENTDDMLRAQGFRRALAWVSNYELLVKEAEEQTDAEQ